MIKRRRATTLRCRSWLQLFFYAIHVRKERWTAALWREMASALSTVLVMVVVSSFTEPTMLVPICLFIVPENLWVVTSAARWLVIRGRNQRHAMALMEGDEDDRQAP